MIGDFFCLYFSIAICIVLLRLCGAIRPHFPSRLDFINEGYEPARSGSAYFHTELEQGGSLVLTMGPKPNESWGSSPDAAPPSLSQ